MAFPGDAAGQPVLGKARPLAPPRSDAASLAAAVEAVAAALARAETACVLPGILVARAGLQPALLQMIDASGLPFATMFMAKSVLDEQHPNYIGMYDGALMTPAVRDFVEGCDRVLVVGSPMSDFNTGAFTARLDPARTITGCRSQARPTPMSRSATCWPRWRSGCRGGNGRGSRRTIWGPPPAAAAMRSAPRPYIRAGPGFCGRTTS